MKSTTSIRSQVMTLANYLKKTMTFSEALRQAWNVAKLQAWLKKGGEAVIRFFKEGSDIPEQRAAVAINADNYQVKGADRKRNPLQISYFELNSNKIKSFNAARFAGFATT
jgi:hypothetical protein